MNTTHPTNPIIFHIRDVGWRVSYNDGTNNASTIVEYADVYERGQVAIDEAIEFVKTTAIKGYNAVPAE